VSPERAIRVLHLEDVEADAELIQQILVDEGIALEVVRVRDRSEFEAALAGGGFDLILSDFSIPGFDGASALKRAADLLPEVPFLFVSGTLGEDYAVEMLKLGATDYILKQRLTRLGAAVRRAIVQAEERRSRLRAEQALQKAQKIAQAVLDSVEAGIIACDADGALTQFNRAARRLHGVEPQTLPAERWAERLGLYAADGETPLAPDEIPLLRALRGDVVRNVEIVIRPPNGTPAKALVSGQAVVDEEGRRLGAVVAVQDITELDQAQEEIARQRDILYQREKLAAMGELLAGVAHELNNPLSVVMGQSSLMRRDAGEGTLGRRAERVHQAAERCARIVRNFLALARQRPPERQSVQINQVVREALELLGYSLRVDGVDVELALAEDLPVLWADPHQLHQVMVNLIANAHQAMRSGPLPRLIIIGSRVDPTGGRVVLEVADTGPGMAPEVQQKIFDPFFTTKAPGEGTGLGLSLCRAMIENHGGTLSVQSAPGRGATFVFELPIEAGPVGTRNETRRSGASAPGRSILVVDDEPEVAAVLADMLVGDGHSVETVMSASAALDRLRSRSYDLVLSDVKMPHLDGPAFWREAKQLQPGLERRFVFITGDMLAPRTRQFLDETGAPLVAKPFSIEDVRRAVGNALDRLDTRDAP
jgi:PAS domain S-box-containing protein